MMNLCCRFNQSFCETQLTKPTMFHQHRLPAFPPGCRSVESFYSCIMMHTRSLLAVNGARPVRRQESNRQPLLNMLQEKHPVISVRVLLYAVSYYHMVLRTFYNICHMTLFFMVTLTNFVPANNFIF
jgi:hypothetical protein